MNPADLAAWQSKARSSEIGMLFSHALACVFIRGILREAESHEQLALQMNGFVR